MALVTKNFGDIITFTRASTATYFDSTGTLQSAAIDAPRFDYDPSTLAAQGLLIEESRTNSIRNNTMVGAVAGTPGTLPTNWSIFTSLTGLTREVVGTGTENGIDYIDFRLSGTPSAAGSYNFHFDAITAVAASVGQVWTLSTYAKLQAGSFTGISSFQLVQVEYNSASVFLTQGNSTISPTSSALNTQRFAYPKTVGNASTAYLRPSSIFNLTGAAIDITLRIGLPQLELGAFATSVIPTTTTALTRAADVASVNTLSPWFNASEGTLYAEYNIPVAVQNQNAVALTDGTNNNRMIIRAANSSTQTIFIGVDTSVTQWSAALAAAPTNATTKSSFAYATNDIAWVRNAGTVGTDATATIPTVNQLKLGADGDGTSRLSGWLRRVTYYPRKLSSAELQAITA